MDEWQVIRERRVGHAEHVKQISRDTGFAINTIRKYSRSSVRAIASIRKHMLNLVDDEPPYRR